MKLLIVDDDIWLCSALSRGLVRLGHFARTAASVDSALALIESEAPAAVLTDLDLGPGGNGVELICRMRGAGSTVPAIMMTGSDPVVARARLGGAGLDETALLEKPFEFEELMKKLAALFPELAAAAPSVRPSRPTPAAAMATMVGSVVRSLGGRVL